LQPLITFARGAVALQCMTCAHEIVAFRRGIQICKIFTILPFWIRLKKEK
jgi:hypothetical protein